MDFGLVFDFRNPPEWKRPIAELYAETLDLIQAVEELGFDTVWVTEHHFIEDEYLPSCLAAAAAIAARTKRVTIGTAVLLLPLHDAVRVAEDAAVVDAFSNGRLRLGLGLGYKAEEFGAFGKRRSARPSLMDEGIAVIRGAWADGPLTFSGKHYELDGINVTPKPVQRPGPEIWIGGRSEPATRRAARLGDGFISGASPYLINIYNETRAAAGRTGPANIAAFAACYPTEDPEGAWQAAGPHIFHRNKNYAEWYGEAADLPSDTAWKQAVDEGRHRSATENVFRTSEVLINDLHRLESKGVSSVLTFGTFPGMRPSAMLPYYETLAREVFPRFR